jgi:hypothetical protein
MMTTELDRQLAALKTSIAGLEPPAAVDRAVAAAIAAVPSQTRGLRWPWRVPAPAWVGWSAALAAALAVVAVVHRTDVPVPTLDAGTPSAAGKGDSAMFMPVVPMSEIARTGDALVVPARLSRMTLAQFGLPVNPARATDAVDTELLVRGDGAVLAVRFSH